MRKITILFLILMLSGFAPGQNKYKTYHNARFGFSISYPSDLLLPQGESFNNAGQIFLSKDKTAEMRAGAHFNALFQTIEEQYQEDLNGYDGNVTYKVLLKNGFVISGIRNDKIFYQKTLYHKFKETDVFYNFSIEYKKSDRKKFDAIVRKIAASFKFNPNANV